MKRVICDDPARVSRFVSEQMGIGSDWEGTYRAVGLESDGEIVAGVVYDNYTGATIFMHIAALPGKKWTRNFLWFMFYYPFHQLGVKALRGMIPASNRESLRFAEGLKGAYLEARLKDAHPEGDMLIYCLPKEDCKYLEIYRNG